MARRPGISAGGGSGAGGVPGDGGGNPAWESGLMLDVYVLDYLRKRQFHTVAENFQKQASVPERALAIDAPSGFLFEWWSVFWDVFIAQTNPTCATEAGSLYLKAQQMKQMQQPNNPVDQARMAVTRGAPGMGQSHGGSPAMGGGMSDQGTGTGEGVGQVRGANLLRMMEQQEQIRRMQSAGGLQQGGGNMRNSMSSGMNQMDMQMPRGGPGPRGGAPSQIMHMGGSPGQMQQMGSPSMQPMGNRMHMHMPVGGGNVQEGGMGLGMGQQGQQQMLMRNMQGMQGGGGGQFMGESDVGGMNRGMSSQRGMSMQDRQQHIMQMQQQRMGGVGPGGMQGIPIGHSGPMMGGPSMGGGNMRKRNAEGVPDGQNGVHGDRQNSMSGLGDFDPAALGNLDDVSVLEDTDSLAPC